MPIAPRRDANAPPRQADRSDTSIRGGIPIGRNGRATAQQRRATKLRKRQRRTARLDDRQRRRDLRDAEDGLALLSGMLRDELREVLQQTLTARDPEAARAFSDRLLSTDEASVAEDDLAFELGFGIAVEQVSRWMAVAGHGLEDPDLPKRTVEWIRSALGGYPGDLASRAVGVMGVMGETPSEDAVARALEDLDADYLPAMIWLLAGVLAVYRGGFSWLAERYQEET